MTKTTKTPTAEINPASKTAKLAAVVEVSDNAKTGAVSATYTGYQTCPDSCEFKPAILFDGGFAPGDCYASQSFAGCTMHRLTNASVDTPLIQIQAAECAGIESLSGERVIRLKVGGDTPNPEYAQALAASCAIHTAKQGQATYGYTHNWENIPRESFGGISMLASCDSIADIGRAKAMGYATATVVAEFPQGAKLFQIDGHTILPCPNQVAEQRESAKPKAERNPIIQCLDCELCFHDGRLRDKGLTIGFVPHGMKKTAMKARRARKVAA